jgi:LemA protein
MKFLKIFLLLLMPVFLSSCGYNQLVHKEEAITAQWAQVENVYQRRADLIPNLVNTVRGAADFERQTLNDVIQARSQATGINVNAGELTPEQIQRFQQAQEQLSGALSRLMVVVERYPDLKANQNFRDLQVQLEGTENRITVERRKFNEVAQEYNSYRRRFPNNIMAGIFGFESKGYFTATPGAERPPAVEF